MPAHASIPMSKSAPTYVRRPFASPRSRLLSVLITFCAGPEHNHPDFCSLRARGGGPASDCDSAAGAYDALFLVGNPHEAQFADSRTHLMPASRRVHAIVAAAAVLIVVVFLPTLLTWAAGANFRGFCRDRRVHVWHNPLASVLRSTLWLLFFIAGDTLLLAGAFTGGLQLVTSGKFNFAWLPFWPSVRP